MKTALAYAFCAASLFVAVDAFVPAASLLSSQARCSRPSTALRMSGDDPLRNVMRSARKPGPNDRTVTLKKPLGIMLEEDERGNVYVKDLSPGGNAARSGKVKKGDLVTMISATFGDEYWSARGAGLGMIMQAIKVRQGDSVNIVLEGQNESADKKARAAQTAAASKAAAEASRKKEQELLAQMESEDKNRSKKFFGLF